MENFAKLLIFLSTPFLRINSLHILANLALSLTLFTIGGGAYGSPPLRTNRPVAQNWSGPEARAFGTFYII